MISTPSAYEEFVMFHFRRWACALMILVLASCGKKEIVPVVVPNPQEDELRELAEELKKLDKAINEGDQEDLTQLPTPRGVARPVGVPIIAAEVLPTPGTGQKLHLVERTEISEIGLSFGAVAMSPDGSTIACTRDKFIYLIDLPTGNVRMVVTETVPSQFNLSRTIPGLVYSADGKSIFTSGDRSVKIWDAESGKVIRAIPYQYGKNVAVSLDGTLIAGCAGSSVRIWNAKTGSIRGDSDELTKRIVLEPKLAWSPDGSVIALGFTEGQVVFIDAKTGKKKSVGSQHSNQKNIASLSFSPDGKLLATTAEEKKILIWDVATGEVSKTIETDTDIRSATFSPGGKVLVGCADQQVKFWDVATNQSLGESRTTCKLESSVFTPDGNALLLNSSDHGIVVADIVAGRERAVFPIKGTVIASAPGVIVVNEDRRSPPTFYHSATGEKKPPIPDWPERWSHPTISADGKTLAVLVNHQQVSLRELPSGKETGKFDIQVPVSLTAFAPDRPWLILGGFGVLEIWDVVEKKKIASLAHDGPIQSVRFVPGGKQLITGTQLGHLQWWDIAEQKLVREALAQQGAITHIALSPDSKTLATIGADDPLMRMWDNATGRELGVVTIPDSARGRFISFTPDGNYFLLLDSVGKFRYWDAKTGDPMFVQPADVKFAIASVDGKQLIGYGADSVHVWNLDELQKVPLNARKDLPPRTPPLPLITGVVTQDSMENYAINGYIPRVLISRDGLFAIAEADKQFFAIDLKAKSIIATGEMDGHFQKSSALSADGSTFVAVAKDEQIHIWDAKSGKLRHRVPVKGLISTTNLSTSADGKWIAIYHSSDTESVVVIDAVSGKRVKGIAWPKEDSRITIDGVYFTADGSLIVQRDESIEWREPIAFVRRFDVKLPERVYAMTVSDDGTLFAASGMDTQGHGRHTPIYVWNSKGELIQTLFGHIYATEAMAFAPDGKSLATNLGNELKVWALTTGKERRTVENFADEKVKRLAFRGEQLIVASGSTFGLWNYNELFDETLQNALEPISHVAKLTRDGDGYHVQMVYSGRSSHDALAKLRGFDKPFALEINYGPTLSDEALSPLREVPKLRRLIVRNAPHVGNPTLLNLVNASELQELVFNVGGNVERSGIEALSKLSKLRKLDILGTSILPDAFPKLKDVTGLESLRLSDDSEGGKWIDIIAELPKLRELELVGPVSDIALKSIPKLKQVRILKCPGTFDDKSLPAIRELIDITELSLIESAITDDGLKQLVALKNLTRLDLSGTMIKGPGLVHLKSLTKLVELSLENMPDEFDDAAIERIAELTQLQKLVLSRTTTDVGVKHLTKLSGLTELKLSNAKKVTNLSIDSLREMKKLEVLDLSGTKITDAGLLKLGEMKSLKRIDITNTDASREAIETLKRSLPTTNIVN